MPLLSDITPGRYIPGKSPAHLLDARLKVLMVGVLSLAVWAVDTFVGLGLLCSLLFLWIMLGKGFARQMMVSARGLIYVVLALTIYYCLTGALRSGDDWMGGLLSSLSKSTLLCGKLALLWLAAIWMTLCTAPLRVVEALSYLLRPLELMRLPVREFTFTVGLILRFFPDSVTRIGNFYQQLKIRETLAGQTANRKKTSYRKLNRIIDAMALYMNYSLYQSELLALSLIARGYNPFRPSFLGSLDHPAAWELGIALFSMSVIFTSALWF